MSRAIGAGGMGEVWKARDPRMDRLVAIKVSKAEFSGHFSREARAIAQLNHSHICQLYDVGPDYLLMECVEGSPPKGPLPMEKAVEYAGQILGAPDAAPRKGITLRDLKPANITVTKQYGIKLLDFGLARIAGAGDSTVNPPGEKMGTPAYMLPEQWEASRVTRGTSGCVFNKIGLYQQFRRARAIGGPYINVGVARFRHVGERCSPIRAAHTSVLDGFASASGSAIGL